MTETIVVLVAVFLFVLGGALFPRSPLFAWSYQLGYWFLRHGPALMRPKWSWDEYRSWHRVLTGVVGAFGLILTVSVWFTVTERH